MTQADLWGGPIEPTWYVLNVMAGREERKLNHLIELGAVAAWYPWQMRRNPAYSRLMARWTAMKAPPAVKAALKPQREIKRQTITGYLFILVDKAPRWHAIKELPDVIDVFKVGNTPRAFSADELAQMKQTPERIAAIAAEMERQRQAERDAKRPVVGGKARICEGLLEGEIVRIASIGMGYSGGKRVEVAEVEMGATRATAPLSNLVRTA